MASQPVKTMTATQCTRWHQTKRFSDRIKVGQLKQKKKSANTCRKAACVLNHMKQMWWDSIFKVFAGKTSTFKNMKWKSFMQQPIIILLGMEENICCKYEYSLVQKNISIFQTLPAAKPYVYDNDYFRAKALNSVTPSYVIGDWKNLKPVFSNSDNLSTHNLRSHSLIL